MPEICLDGRTVTVRAPQPPVTVTPPSTTTLRVGRPSHVALTVTAPQRKIAVTQAPDDHAATALVVPVVGPPGPPGAGNGGYKHHQTNPAAQWNIHHGLGYRREPTLLLDADPDTPVWGDVHHIDDNTLFIVLPEPATGWAEI